MEHLESKIMLLNERVDRLNDFKTDAEARLRRMEKALYLGMGALAVLQFILKYAH